MTPEDITASVPQLRKDFAAAYPDVSLGDLYIKDLNERPSVIGTSGKLEEGEFNPRAHTQLLAYLLNVALEAPDSEQRRVFNAFMREAVKPLTSERTGFSPDFNQIALDVNDVLAKHGLPQSAFEIANDLRGSDAHNSPPPLSPHNDAAA